MFATLHLLLIPGLGRLALVVDVVLSVGVAVAIGVVATRSRRRQAPVGDRSDVVAEAEAVVSGVHDRQPA